MFINDCKPTPDGPSVEGPRGIIDKSKASKEPEKNKGFSAFCFF